MMKAFQHPRHNERILGTPSIPKPKEPSYTSGKDSVSTKGSYSNEEVNIIDCVMPDETAKRAIDTFREAYRKKGRDYYELSNAMVDEFDSKFRSEGGWSCFVYENGKANCSCRFKKSTFIEFTFDDLVVRLFVGSS